MIGGGNGAARSASNKSVANGLLAPPSEDLIDSTWTWRSFRGTRPQSRHRGPRQAGRGHRLTDFRYYRCSGTDAYRFGGERICSNTQIRAESLEAETVYSASSMMISEGFDSPPMNEIPKTARRFRHPLWT